VPTRTAPCLRSGRDSLRPGPKQRARPGHYAPAAYDMLILAHIFIKIHLMESGKDYPSLLNPGIINSYWVYKCAAIPGITTKVFPQGYSNIVFYFRDDTESDSCADSVYPYIFIGGEATRTSSVTYQKDDFIIVALVKSCYLHALLKTGMEVFTDMFIPLEEIDTKLALRLKACCDEITPEQKLSAIDRRLYLLFSGAPRSVGGLSRAVDLIKTSRGLCSLDEVLEDLNVSARTLERGFMRMMGVTPKTYLRIIRWNSVLHDLKLHKGRPLVHTALDFGYYDQAHFINDFKKLYGSPPSQFTVR